MAVAVCTLDGSDTTSGIVTITVTGEEETEFSLDCTPASVAGSGEEISGGDCVLNEAEGVGVDSGVESDERGV